MVFGKDKHIDEPPVPLFPWAEAWEFAISNEERPAADKRKRPVLGVRAFRVPHGSGAQRVNAPCAFFPRETGTEAQGSQQRLYADAEGRVPLCSIDAPEDIDGARRFVVRDDAGQPIGAVLRIPPLKHALKPTWRLAQPGRPEIVSSAEWAAGGVTEMVQQGAGKFLVGAIQAVADLGAEGGDQTNKARMLEWKAEGELVMTSNGRHGFLIRAAWLDRRLVFSYALLRAR
ncbi:hypothetical protein [Streptomyces sp. NPDC058867]|uniref:hypothetical protein n=1 Tax=unclassified Streptomyces TaxID=2593676 RepID=UPI00368BD096